MRNIYSDAPKKESFFANHVRLITFLVVIGLFLLICGPIFVMEAVEYFGAGMDTRPQMTQQDLIVLSEMDETVYLEQVTRFAGDQQDKQNEIYFYMEIEPCYTVVVIADKNTHAILYCNMLNNETNERVDVLVDDVRTYLETQEKYR